MAKVNLEIIILRYLISVSTIILNSFLIYAIWKRNKLKIVSYWLISCLSISDVFYGISVLITESAEPQPPTFCSAEIACLIANISEFFFGNFSATFLLIIAIDRFIHMKYILRYHTIMTKKRAVALVCFNVVFTGHIVVTIILLPKYQRQFLLKHLQSYRIYRAVLSFVYFSIVLSVCALYVITYFSLRRRVNSATNVETIEMGETSQEIQENDKPKVPNIYNNGRRRPDREFAVCIMFVIILLFFFEAPNLLVTVYIRVSMLIQRNFAYTNEIVLASRWTYILFQLNSTLNAAVILVFSRELRSFIKELFKRSTNAESGPCNSTR